MRYQIPQYITTEDKIVGPFTLYQFIWVVAIVGAVFISYKTLDTLLFITTSILAVIVGGAFGFVKIDNMTLMKYLGYMISFMLKPKKYLFQKQSSMSDIASYSVIRHGEDDSGANNTLQP